MPGDDSAVTILAQSVTERLAVHRSELNEHDKRLLEHDRRFEQLRDEVLDVLGGIKAEVGQVRQEQAVMSQIVKDGSSLINKILVALLGVIGTVLAVGLGLIFFGPGA